jgi:hypothetical protein
LQRGNHRRGFRDPASVQVRQRPKQRKRRKHSHQQKRQNGHKIHSMAGVDRRRQQQQQRNPNRESRYHHQAEFLPLAILHLRSAYSQRQHITTAKSNTGNWPVGVRRLDPFRIHVQLKILCRPALRASI